MSRTCACECSNPTYFAAMKFLISSTLTCIFSVVIIYSCSNPGNPISPADEKSGVKGKLFIIGGGDRDDSLNLAMIEASGVESGGYIVVLPMASSVADSSYLWFLEDIRHVTQVPCFNFHLGEKDYVNTARLDSLKKAKLIFICGGDQSRFMDLVRNTTIHDAIREAYKNGATIAGTSAGAAMMSNVMITGDQTFSEEYEGTYRRLWKENAIYSEGLGLLDSTVIDQHFVARSRYNRLLTSLCDYPGMMGVGIDESTAIIVEGKKATVLGASQVLVFHPVDSCRTNFHHLGLRDVHLDVLFSGQSFELK